MSVPEPERSSRVTPVEKGAADRNQKDCFQAGLYETCSLYWGPKLQRTIESQEQNVCPVSHWKCAHFLAHEPGKPSFRGGCQ